MNINKKIKDLERQADLIKRISDFEVMFYNGEGYKNLSVKIEETLNRLKELKKQIKQLELEIVKVDKEKVKNELAIEDQKRDEFNLQFRHQNLQLPVNAKILGNRYDSYGLWFQPQGLTRDGFYHKMQKQIPDCDFNIYFNGIFYGSFVGKCLTPNTFLKNPRYLIFEHLEAKRDDLLGHYRLDRDLRMEDFRIRPNKRFKPSRHEEG